MKWTEALKAVVNELNQLAEKAQLLSSSAQNFMARDSLNNSSSAPGPGELRATINQAKIYRFGASSPLSKISRV